MEQIPDRIATRVQAAMAKLKWCEEELGRLFDLDSRFGGNGRYESEGWDALKGQIEQANGLIAQFRTIATGKGIDADAVLKACGGVATPIRSQRAIFYAQDCEAA